jgi:L-seryl-tRNA(Ser) seleniumtransferase
MASSAMASSPRDKQLLLRQLPKVDQLAAAEELAPARLRLGVERLVAIVREAVSDERAQVVRSGEAPSRRRIIQAVETRIGSLLASRALRVINATGVVLHTNLGRAPLSARAVAALAESAGGYTSIEIDRASGRRGPRGAFAEHALAQLCGAEDALVVNNNAAAVLLVLTALARGRGVVVSRGELVEIGGGFRVPDVLARSGARMIEVGTTNRTRLADYQRALDEDGDVAVLLRVHQGNFQQIGFVERPELAALARLARDRGALLVKDLGGGALVDLSADGLPGEPMARAAIEAGAHSLCFSCDKLLGGPQGGAIVGDADLVARVRRDPLARALRLGRLPLVALEATLESYLADALDELPTMAMLRAPVERVRARVEGWCRALSERGVEARPVEVSAAVGGGALAGAPLASWAACLATEHPDAVAERLRLGQPPVMPRIHEGMLLIDGRTVLPDEDERLLAAAVAAMGA